MSTTEVLLRIILATVLGSLIGLEREFFGKAAGLRTHVLVAVASCLLMELSIFVFFEFQGMSTSVDPGRIAAQVVTGVGFLGAGAIIRSGFNVTGLTTAASLWAVAAVGLSCGIGFYSGAIFATLVILVVLLILSRIEKVIPQRNKPAD